METFRRWFADGSQICVTVLIGLMAGAASLRDSVVSELRDSVLAIENINQHLSYNGLTSGTSETSGSDYLDAVDLEDGEDCISFSEAPEDESGGTLEDTLADLDHTYTLTRGGSVWTGAADFDDGVYTGSPWGTGATYAISGTTITVTLDTSPWANWVSSVLVLDASDPANMTGTINWTHDSGFVWTGDYEIICF